MGNSANEDQVYIRSSKNRDPNSGKFAANARNVGCCGKLTGSQMFLFIFVSTPKRVWTKKDIDDFFVHAYKTRDILDKASKKYGVSLSLQYKYFSFSLSYEPEVWGNHNWVKDILNENFNSLKNVPEVAEYYADRFGVKACAVFFVFISEGRSYAVTEEISNPGWKGEYVMLRYYKNQWYMDKKILHEALHLYGAIDFYYPDDVEKAAKKYYPKSVMLTTSYDEIDALTAYLIGWTDNTDKYSQYFIDLIEWIGPYKPPKVKD